MKRIVLSLLLLGMNMAAWAASGVVQGKIIDARSKEALEFVTVSLRRQGTDALLKGTITDEEGGFVLEGLADGSYVLIVSYVGYKDLNRNVEITSSSPRVNLNRLLLEEDSQLLGEVEVVGQKSQMRFELDKRVFNVDQNIASTGGSASDVLTNIPSVEVDNEGQVSLRGSSSVTVWINGKASGLTSDNRGDILQQLPAENIERVEVITNPSARYSPEGTAGIINIVLKRDRRAGYYGGVQAGADVNGGYNVSGNVNYSSGTLEAYANLGYRRRLSPSGGYTNRSYLAEDGSETSSLNQESDGEMDGKMTFTRAGATWHVTEKDHLSVSGMGMFGGHDRENTIDYLSSERGSTVYNRLRNQSEDGDMTMFNVELGYKHDFSEESNLDFTLSHNQWRMDGNNIYDDLTRYTAGGVETALYQLQDNRRRNKTWEAQLDYVNKWGENHRLEAGYKGSFRRENSPVRTYSGSNAADAVFDASLYNRFIYDQDIHALYLTYGGRWGQLSYQAGLRGEYTRTQSQPMSWSTEGDSELAGDLYKDDYFKLFPSLFVSYALPAGNEVQLNYTRRISRPWGGQLNSFRNITDATNISFGNPELTPEYSNAFELNYIKNWEEHMLSFSGYYRTTDEVIQRISFRGNDNVMYSTYENVAQSQSAGMELVAKNKLFRFLDLTSTVNLFYYKLDGFNFMPDGSQSAVTGEDDENFSWNARVIANMALPAAISLQVTGNYNARQVVAQGYRRPNYSLDAGLRRSFFDRKLSISVNARDVLASRKWKTVTSGIGFRQSSESWWGGRYVGFTLTYNFGNMSRNNGKGQRQQFDDGGTGGDMYGGEPMGN